MPVVLWNCQGYDPVIPDKPKRACSQSALDFCFNQIRGRENNLKFHLNDATHVVWFSQWHVYVRLHVLPMWVLMPIHATFCPLCIALPVHNNQDRLLRGIVQATAIGANNQAAQSILRQDYKEDITLDEALKLVIKVCPLLPQGLLFSLTYQRIRCGR